MQYKIPLSCDRQNFSACDRCVLNLLNPHLIQGEENPASISQVQQILRQLKQALDQEGLISLASDGQVQLMSQQAENLLKKYFLFSNSNSLPEPLDRWVKHQISQLTSNSKTGCLPLHIEQAGKQLSVNFISNSISQQYVLLLEERKSQPFSIATLELLGLTKREAEVLFWITKDKSNAGISKALGCSEGTVRKHLENIYKKLGVQTRMGAVMVALERLGLLNS